MFVVHVCCLSSPELVIPLTPGSHCVSNLQNGWVCSLLFLRGFKQMVSKKMPQPLVQVIFSLLMTSQFESQREINFSLYQLDRGRNLIRDLLCLNGLLPVSLFITTFSMSNLLFQDSLKVPKSQAFWKYHVKLCFPLKAFLSS